MRVMMGRAGDSRRWGRWGRLAMAVPLALLMAGCMKMDVGITIRDDDHIDLTMSVGVLDSVASTVAPSGDLCQAMTGTSGPMISLPGQPGMKSKDENGYLTCEISATVSIADINSAGFSVVHEADTYHFHMDSLAGETSASNMTLTSSMISSFRVAVTFPGAVISHNGSSTVSGNTVTWTSAADAMSPDGLDAVGGAKASSSSLRTIIVAAIAALAVVAIGAIVFWLVKGRKKAPAQPAGYPEYATYAQGGPAPQPDGSAPGPYGAAYGTPPYGQASYGQTSYGQTSYDQTAYGQTPYGQTPYGQTQSGQAPYGQTPYGQAPSDQTAYGQTPYGQTPYGQTQSGQAPYGQTQYGQTPYGQTTYGQADGGLPPSSSTRDAGPAGYGTGQGYAAPQPPAYPWQQGNGQSGTP